MLLAQEPLFSLSFKKGKGQETLIAEWDCFHLQEVAHGIARAPQMPCQQHHYLHIIRSTCLAQVEDVPC